MYAPKQSIMGYDFFKELKSLPYVKQIILFGSRARGDNQERADIDIAIVCPEASAEQWSVIEDIMDNADTLLKIDYIRFDKLNDNSPIKQSIVNEGVKLI